MSIINPDLLNNKGVPLTKSLFREADYSRKEHAIFTLGTEDVTEDGKTYLSLYKLYMTFNDPSEHMFAKGVFGSWKAWERIRNSAVLRDYLPKWREELEVKMKSQALSTIVELATDTSKPQTALTASKFILKEYFEKPKKTTRGRPSKEEVEGELKKEAQVSKELKEHMARVGLTRVK